MDDSGILSSETVESATEIQLNTETLKVAFQLFSQKQGPSTSALIKLFEPRLEGLEITVPMHKGNLNLTEPVKVDWQLFLRQYFSRDNLVLNLVEDNTVVKQTKAYTQREQLDELVKENPLMRDLIRKLNLKLK